MILGITALLAVITGGKITNPIVETSSRIKQISESLDLSSRVEISASNEVGETAEAFNGLLDKFQEIISEVDNSVIHITDAAEQLANSTTDASTRIQDQEVQTEQVATAMTELTIVVERVSSNADTAATAAQEANSEATAGKNVVNETVNVINNLAHEVETATAAIQRVGEKSQSIDSVLAVIRGIAEQTNLLALNAAIEAARAGDQGRGFAVVADEVRNLASRTQESTQEIQQTIEQLQSGVNDAISAIKSGQGQTHESVAQVNNAGQSLNVITEAVDKINQLNGEIANSFKEQALTTEDVNQNVIGISQLTEQAAQDAQNNATSSQRLSQLSDQLRNLVGKFKL